MSKKQVLVDYASIKMNPEKLLKYISQLEKLSKKSFDSFTADQKLAFWINAYNAYTVKLIVDNYSNKLKSIKDLGGLFSSPWSKSFIPLFGKKMSLDDVEHKTIRKNFKEARIHFVVNCASIGCPSLYREAIVASKLEKQLDAATLHFLNNSQKNHLKGETLMLSKIFDWYQEDFVKYHKSVREFVRKYMKGNIPKDPKIKYLDYDWSLNKYR